MRKIVILGILVLTCLGSMSCGTTEKQEEKRVLQGDTQTTNVVSGQALEVIESDNIENRNYMPVQCRNREKELEREFSEGDFNWDHPDVVLNPYGDAPLTAYIYFRTQNEYSISFRVKGKNSKVDVVGEIPISREHRIPIVGLYPDNNNKVEIALIDKEGEEVLKKVIRIQTGKLPRSMGQVVRCEKGGVESAYGLTIISGQTTPYPFAYDINGDVRWYITKRTGSYGIFPLANHHMIYQTDASLTPTEEKPHTTQMYEMDYLGRVYQIYYVKNGIHHEVIEKEADGNLLVLSSSIDGHTEDVVLELDRATGAIVKELDMRNVFDKTYEDKVDWVHLNTASYQKKDDTVLLSPRNVHAGIKVDWKTNEIKWILANPKMFKGTAQENKVLKPQGDITWHFQQHSVYEIEEDLDDNPNTIHVMMFDNHWQNRRKVDFFDNKKQSYVTVYTINEKKMTVKQEKLFPGVRSVITSNCAFVAKERRIFSFGGYLHPEIDGRQGMVYEFDYDSKDVLNQYSTKYFFYRGYKMDIDWLDLSQKFSIDENYVKGTLQAPIKAEKIKVPEKMCDSEDLSFLRKEDVLYMHTSDHSISKIQFQGEKNQYCMDYSSAGKGMESKGNQKYHIAIPLGEMAADEYQIYVKYRGQWCATGHSFIHK